MKEERYSVGVQTFWKRSGNCGSPFIRSVARHLSGWLLFPPISRAKRLARLWPTNTKNPTSAQVNPRATPLDRDVLYYIVHRHLYMVRVISEFLEHHSKVKCTRAPAYSWALQRIKGIVQSVVHGKLTSDFQSVRNNSCTEPLVQNLSQHKPNRGALQCISVPGKR